jgi:phenazine biosynthesis protein phzE
MVLDRPETVGFYNTFVARVPVSGLPEGITVEADVETRDIHLLTGPHYRGVQFHAESILTRNGYLILRDLVTQLLDPASDSG